MIIQTRRARAAIALTGALAVLVGGTAVFSATEGVPGGTVPAPAAIAAPATDPPPVTVAPRTTGDIEPVRRVSAPTPVQPGVPTGITIPAIGVVTNIAVTRVVDGVFQVPDNIQTVGWDQGTVKPGSRRGTSLMAGHLDDDQRNDGALHDLQSLDRGDTITVATRRGDVTYRVTSVRVYDKRNLPPAIVARTGGHRLALVTCKPDDPDDPDDLVRGSDGLLHYRDNIVVWAVPIR